MRADWLVPGAFNGGFTSPRVPIPYFNVNIAGLAQKLDEWAVMPDEVLDLHKARALELHGVGIRRCCGRITRRCWLNSWSAQATDACDPGRGRRLPRMLAQEAAHPRRYRVR